MAIAAEDRDKLRAAFVRRHCDADPDHLTRAGADAGLRSYWRLPGGLVLMDAPPADNDAGAWLTVQALLESQQVRVPRVVATDLGRGFILMEDLGTKTLLESVDADNADGYFEAAFAQLLRLQAITPPAAQPACDAELMGAELDLFPDWFVARELRLTLDAGEKALWQEVRRFLIDQALAQPQVLVHRDFMPRNLMPNRGAMAVIDFQDAVTGPITYDPLCLFKDAFLSWPAERIEAWLRRYHAMADAAGLPVPDWSTFRRDIDLIGVQRHFKVIGIFARLKHRDGKPRYLEDIPRFRRYLEEVLPQHAELHALDRWLTARIWPAWDRRGAA